MKSFKRKLNFGFSAIERLFFTYLDISMHYRIVEHSEVFFYLSGLLNSIVVYRDTK